MSNINIGIVAINCSTLFIADWCQIDDLQCIRRITSSWQSTPSSCELKQIKWKVKDTRKFLLNFNVEFCCTSFGEYSIGCTDVVKLIVPLIRIRPMSFANRGWSYRLWWYKAVTLYRVPPFFKSLVPTKISRLLGLWPITQCDAVTAHFWLMIEQPQKWNRLDCIEHWYGASPSWAVVPPTIRVFCGGNTEINRYQFITIYSIQIHAEMHLLLINFSACDCQTQTKIKTISWIFIVGFMNFSFVWLKVFEETFSEATMQSPIYMIYSLPQFNYYLQSTLISNLNWLKNIAVPATVLVALLWLLWIGVRVWFR